MGKITFVPAQSLPLDKLAASSANVRRIKAGVSIAELAEDIGRRGLLQSLNVRAVLDESGAETGKYAVVAGGRRFAALQLLVKSKRLAKNAPVPCIVKPDGVAAEEDSLAENTMREALHPLDQFRAFQALRDEHLMGDEEIAARFFVTPAVVRQRLKLAAVSPKLLDLYADDAMTLEQLMAFTVTADHARQEAVWEALSRSYSRDPALRSPAGSAGSGPNGAPPYAIRRMLTEGAVKPTDKRAMFVGLETYEAAGGVVERDLFAEDGGGFLRDAALLDRLVEEKLAREADTVRQEGWLWVEAARDLPYGHVFGLRRLYAEVAPLGVEEQAERDRLQAESDALEAEYATSEDLPDDADRRLGEIEQRLAQLDALPQIFDPAEVARAGAFLSVDYVGVLKVERGYVRPEDEPREAQPEGAVETSEPGSTADAVDSAEMTNGGTSMGDDPATAITPVPDDDDEDDCGRISDRLMTELTAHRTLALRAALSADPDAAHLAVLHALALRTFYGTGADSCLEIEGRSVALGGYAPTLSDTQSSRILVEQHGLWQGQLPRNSRELWLALVALDADSRAALFTLCVGRSINALVQSWDRRPAAIAHADRLAEYLRLDMAAEGGWAPTADNYLGRVTKARILAAVGEAKGETAADSIAHLRKTEMAEAAEQLLAGTGWLPGPLRTPGLDRALPEGAVNTEADADAPSGSKPEALPAFLTEVGEADGFAPAAETDPDPALAAPAIAAE